MFDSREVERVIKKTVYVQSLCAKHIQPSGGKYIQRFIRYFSEEVIPIGQNSFYLKETWNPESKAQSGCYKLVCSFWCLSFGEGKKVTIYQLHEDIKILENAMSEKIFKFLILIPYFSNNKLGQPRHQFSSPLYKIETFGLQKVIGRYISRKSFLKFKCV